MPRPATVLYAALAATDAALAAAGRDGARRFTKPLLMPVLMIGRDRSVKRALALGGAGDVALLGGSEAAFTAGLVSFLAGHLAWVAALRPRSGGLIRRRPVLVLPYVAAWIGLNAFLWPRTGKHRVPVLVYSATLLSTALAALDTGDPLASAGGVLFMASDSLLALEHFGNLRVPGQEGVVMTTYAAAQACLAHGGRSNSVEAMRLCSNPSASPAFNRLLNVVSDSPDISNRKSAVSWGDAVRRRSQVQRRLQPTEIERLCDEYLDGATASDLAVRYEIHRTTAFAILNRSGVERRGKGPSDEDTALALELYELGNSTSSIGALLGFSGETIRQRILAAGLQVRGPHDWHRRR